MEKPSILRLALRKIKEGPVEVSPPSEVPTPSALEQAMSDFEAAKSPSERAAAFKAALELSKSEE